MSIRAKRRNRHKQNKNTTSENLVYSTNEFVRIIIPRRVKNEPNHPDRIVAVAELNEAMAFLSSNSLIRRHI